MADKNVKTRIVHKHDTPENWAKAVNFVPKQGELIIYDDRYIDAGGNEVIVASAVGYKIGDGVKKVKDLPFLGNPISIYSKGLEFTSNGDGTCYFSGIGSCTDTDIVIPPISPDGDKVTSIGERAFFNCTSLTSIEIPVSVTSIGDSTFYECESLTSIEIPASVTSISDHAFYDCSSLTSIEIPASVTSIGDAAFWDCTALTDVYYSGGEEEWAAIEIGSYGNDYLKNATIYYNFTDNFYKVTDELNCISKRVKNLGLDIGSTEYKIAFGSFEISEDSDRNISEFIIDTGLSEIISIVAMPTADVQEGILGGLVQPDYTNARPVILLSKSGGQATLKYDNGGVLGFKEIMWIAIGTP